MIRRDWAETEEDLADYPMLLELKARMLVLGHRPGTASRTGAHQGWASCPRCGTYFVTGEVVTPCKGKKQ